VRYADVSFNTEIYTIQERSKEAQKQNKMHKIIIMIKWVIYAEGVMGEELIEFYGKILSLPIIEIRGIGTNLNCLSGIMLHKINSFN
jgi:predicted amino acid racemase